MRLDKAWTPHTVTVERFAGEGANGPIFEPARTITNVYLEMQNELVIDDQGNEVVSLGRVIFNLADTPPQGSKITHKLGPLPERTATAFKVAAYDHPAWPGYAIAYLR